MPMETNWNKPAQENTCKKYRNKTANYAENLREIKN